MSETAEETVNPILEAIEEQQPPLAPEVPEEVEAEAEPETPPSFSKPLQKLQMENANLRKEVGAIKKLLEQGLSAKSETTKEDKLAKVREILAGSQGEELERYVPGLRDIVQTLTEEVAESRQSISDSRKARQQSESFEEYMADKPSGFRDAFVEKQAELQAELESEGEKVDEFQLRIAMKEWAKGYLKTAGTPAPKPAPGGKSVIPSTTGARRPSAQTPENLSRQLQQGIGGNLLGVTMKNSK